MANVTVTKDRYTVDSLYQWSKDQDLIITGLSLASIPEIHFTNDTMDKAIVRQATMNDAGVITARIPNSLLQKPYKIRAYVCIYEGESFRSLYLITIPIEARSMPTDYKLTVGDDEVYSFNALENLVNNTLVTLTADNKKVIEEVTKKCDETVKNVKESNQTLETNLNKKYEDTKKAVEESNEQLQTSLNQKYEGSVQACNNAMEETRQANQNEIQNKNAEMSARVDNLIAHNNDTDGNSELVDMRVGANGAIYESAGSAVRGQFSKWGQFISDKRNLLPSDMVWSDKSLTFNSSGEIIDDVSYTDSIISDFIDVDPGVTYTSLTSIRLIAMYTADGTFIRLAWGKAVGTCHQFTTLNTCRKVRIVIKSFVNTRYAKDIVLLEGAFSSRPQRYGYTYMEDMSIESENLQIGTVTNDKLAYDSVKEENCNFISTNKDFLNGITWVPGSCTGYGEIDSLINGWVRTDYLAVSPSTEYMLTSKVNISLYGFNRSKVPCGADERGTVNIGEDCKFTTPEDCYYIIISKLPNASLEMYLATANTVKRNTFTMPGLRVGLENMGNDVLGSIKVNPSSIFSGLVFADTTKHIKLIGDSITHGMGSSDFAQSTDESDFILNAGTFPQYRNYGVTCWAGMLKTYLESKFNCNVVNNGTSGVGVNTLLENWDTLISDEDDIIICMIGTNDRGKTLTFYAQTLLSLYQKANDAGKRIIFMSPPPSSLTDENNSRNLHLEDIDNACNYVSDAIGVGYISIYKSFLNYCRDKDIEIDSLLADGLHPNDAGYKVMFEIILETLGFGRKRDGATW